MQGNDLLHVYLSNPLYNNHVALSQYFNEWLRAVTLEPKIVNQQNEYGHTILHLLCVLKNTIKHTMSEESRDTYFKKTLERLLQNGADLRIQNKKGKTAVDLFWQVNPIILLGIDNTVINFFNLILKYQPFFQLILKFLNKLSVIHDVFWKYFLNALELNSLTIETLQDLNRWVKGKITDLKYSTQTDFNNTYATLSDELINFQIRIKKQIKSWKEYPNLTFIINKITSSKNVCASLF